MSLCEQCCGSNCKCGCHASDKNEWINIKNQLSKEEQIQWILVKFLKDSLDFLAEDSSALGMKRMDWIREWIATELPRADQWMPKK